MSVNRKTTLVLSDEDIDLLYAAIECLIGDYAGTGEELPEGAQKMSDRLMRARSRVRAALEGNCEAAEARDFEDRAYGRD